MTNKVTAWVDAYRAAWESNDPEQIAALFTETAEYRTEPYSEPWVGHKSIVDRWLDAADEPGETTFEWSLVVETPDLGVIQAQTEYRDGPKYNNLWVIGFADDGRATHFTEWWMERTTPTDE
jgi:hypothetical protein